MVRPTAVLLRVGDWCVNATSGQISRDGQIARLEVRTMRLLLCLAERAGEVVSIDDLLNEAWSGVSVSQDSVYQAVASLRRLLGDDPKQPTYIETVPRLGYRMVATVSPWVDQSTVQTAPLRTSDSEAATGATSDLALTGARPNPRGAWVVGAALCIALGVVALLSVGNMSGTNRATGRAVHPEPLKSIAVLPFHDLTEEMTQTPFADGMTVELVDKLSKLPGLRVHAPMSSASLEGSRFTIADMAKMMDVAYVVDGSVRKSGNRLRVVARLIHAADEYVVWSETYDRSLDDIVSVQDEIANKVTKALRGSL